MDMRTIFEALTVHKDRNEKINKKEDFISYQLIYLLKKDKLIKVLKKDEYFQDLLLRSEESLRVLDFYDKKKISAPEAERDVYDLLERLDDFLYEIFE